MSCRTGRLRGERSLRDRYTGLGRIVSKGSDVVRHEPSNARTLACQITLTRSHVTK